MTDEAAYKRIQNTFSENLLLFVKTGRIGGITMMFPAFAAAKTGPAKLEAASSWEAKYTDDLDEVVISGGITAE